MSLLGTSPCRWYKTLALFLSSKCKVGHKRLRACLISRRSKFYLEKPRFALTCEYFNRKLIFQHGAQTVHHVPCYILEHIHSNQSEYTQILFAVLNMWPRLPREHWQFCHHNFKYKRVYKLSSRHQY